MSKAKVIPLDEMNKQIANDCRNNAQKLREEADYLEKCADIIDSNKDYDQYELLKEFVEWLKDQNASYDEKLGLNMVCMDTLQLDDMLKYFIKEREK